MEQQNRNGIINVRKEKGYTSFDVVAKLRGILQMKKIGHTGTLDPDAEGVLPVCLGKATKVCDLLTDKDKEYEAVLLLGKVTDTQDISGTVLSEAEVNVTEEAVRRTVMSFLGTYEQIPPMYSALKVGGRKLCDLARGGIEVERRARTVIVYGITILDMQLPRVRMRVHCSKGTYIRTLCQDIGDKLGCGGCMEALLRTRVADFCLEEAYTLGQLQELRDSGRIDRVIVPIDRVFRELPGVTVRHSFEGLLYNGNKLPVQSLRQDKSVGAASAAAGDTAAENSGYPGTDTGSAPRLRVYDEAGHFVGIYEYLPENETLKPVKMFLT